MVALEPGRMTSDVVPGIGSPGRRKMQLDAGLEGERIEVVEVRDARIGEHGDERLAAGHAFLASVEGERVLGREAAGIPEEGHEAEAGPAGGLLDRLHAVREQRRVAAELVDDEAGDVGRVLGCDDGLGAGEAGDDAAAVDVADEDDRHVGGAGEAEVGDVAGAQVDLGGRARAFDEDEIGFARTVGRSCRARVP